MVRRNGLGRIAPGRRPVSTARHRTGRASWGMGAARYIAEGHVLDKGAVVAANRFRAELEFDVATLVSTRRALHALAECVLAADLYRHIGKIGLRPTTGGF